MQLEAQYLESVLSPMETIVALTSAPAYAMTLDHLARSLASVPTS